MRAESASVAGFRAELRGQVTHRAFSGGAACLDVPRRGGGGFAQESRRAHKRLSLPKKGGGGGTRRHHTAYFGSGR